MFKIGVAIEPAPKFYTHSNILFIQIGASNDHTQKILNIFYNNLVNRQQKYCKIVLKFFRIAMKLKMSFLKLFF